MRRRGERVDRAGLVDELVGLTSVVGAMAVLDVPDTTDCYGQLCDLAARLGFPPPPPFERMGERHGPWTPTDAWFAACGIR